MEQVAKLEGTKGFEEQKTKGVSPWLLSVPEELGPERRSARWSYTRQDFVFEYESRIGK